MTSKLKNANHICVELGLRCVTVEPSIPNSVEPYSPRCCVKLKKKKNDGGWETSGKSDAETSFKFRGKGR